MSFHKWDTSGDTVAIFANTSSLMRGMNLVSPDDYIHFSFHSSCPKLENSHLIIALIAQEDGSIVLEMSQIFV